MRFCALSPKWEMYKYRVDLRSLPHFFRSIYECLLLARELEQIQGKKKQFSNPYMQIKG